MELLATIFEALLCLIDGVAAIADIVAWVKGRENRRIRKQASKKGSEPPPRDKWNRLWICLTIIVVITTSFLIVRRL